MRSRLYLLSLVLSLALPSIAAAQTASLPSGFYLEDVAPGSSFNLPVALEFASGGRVFVAEKAGRIHVVENGIKLSTPFIDLSAEVMSHGDRGLLGFTLDPDFENNGYAYLLYTFDRDGSGDYSRLDVVGRLTRFAVDSTDANRLDPTTRHVLIGETYADGIPACFYSHAVGAIRFGHDGSLLVSAGDGASYVETDPGGLTDECFVEGLDEEMNDVGSFRSQFVGSLSGKVLRIDPETGLGLDSNPFYTGDPSDIASKVWAMGLRNPYRFTVARDYGGEAAGPGTLYISDVGAGLWEELNISRGGDNFGWPCYEGPYEATRYHEVSPAHSGCDTEPPHTSPTYYLKHDNENLSFPSGLRSNTLVVGDIYAGTKYPTEYRDRLFYADYGQGWVASAEVLPNGGLDGQWVFGFDMGPVVDWRYNPHDEYFYFVNVWTGTAMRVRHNDENRPPVAVASTNVTAGLVPLDVEFSSMGSYDPDGDPVRVVWSFGDGKKTKNPNPLHTYTEPGLYTATATVFDDSGASSTKTFVISAGNTMPEAIVFTPRDHEVVSVDDVLDLFGTGSDEQDPAKHLDYSWRIISRHNNHYHPDVFASEDRNTAFLVEEHGIPEEVNYLEVKLAVTDRGGLSDTTTHYVEIRRAGEVDVTSQGAPIAVTDGNSSSDQAALARLGDGIMIEPGSAASDIQFDTHEAADSVEHWIGYEFSEPIFIDRLEFQEGEHSEAGGWFNDLRVEVMAGGEWSDVTYLSILSPYQGNQSGGGKTYSMQFLATFADAVRVIGPPGGSQGYITAAELRVFALPSPRQNRLETVVVGDVSATDWTTVGLRNNFGKMVVVCSPVQDDNDSPVVARIRRATGSSFDIRLQSADPTAAVVPEDVHCAATSAGVWHLPDGSMLHAGRYESSVIDSPDSLGGERQQLASGLGDPIVLGQVMSYNDPRFLTFWSRGAQPGDAPSAGELYTGVFDASDSSATDASEIVAYIAVERGQADGSSFAFEAGSATGLNVAGSPASIGFVAPFAAAPGAALVSTVASGAHGPAVTSLAATPLTTDSVRVVARSQASEVDSLYAASVHFVTFGSSAANYELQIPSLPTIPSGMTASKTKTELPASFEITELYPNPFEHDVTVGFSLPDTREVTADIYDVLGRHVATIMSGEKVSGLHKTTWTGKTANGAEAAPGVYLLVLTSDDDRVERKLVKSR